MRSRLFSFVSILSLLFCAAAIIVWPRSTSGEESLSLPLRWKSVPSSWALTEVAVFWSLGTVGMHWSNSTWNSPTLVSFPPETPRVGVIRHKWQSFRPQFADVWRGRFTCYLNAYRDKQASSFYLVAGCPCWFLIGASAVLPSLWLSRRIHRYQKLPRGQCQTCGYDLTGNTSGVCPECGAPAAGAAT